MDLISCCMLSAPASAPRSIKYLAQSWMLRRQIDNTLFDNGICQVAQHIPNCQPLQHTSKVSTRHSPQQFLQIRENIQGNALVGQWLATHLLYLHRRKGNFSDQTSKTTRSTSQNMASRYSMDVTAFHDTYKDCTWISFKDFSRLAVGIALSIFEGISKGLKIDEEKLRATKACGVLIYILQIHILFIFVGPFWNKMKKVIKYRKICCWYLLIRYDKCKSHSHHVASDALT